MLKGHCLGPVCFAPLVGNGPKIFGFSEFLAALALMVLCWTIADFRYRFRIRTAPIPLQWVTFLVVGAIGLLTLLTDWWRAEHWLVPQGRLITPAAWQVVLGLAFLSTFMTWAWFAFIRPAHFGVRNARRFGGELYRTVLRGSPSELPEVADELIRSAHALVQFAWQDHATESSTVVRPSRRARAREEAKIVAHEIADQWRAFFRLAIVTLADCVSRNPGELPQVISNVMSQREYAHSDLQRLNGTSADWWSDPAYQRFKASVDFAKEILKTLNKGGLVGGYALRNRGKRDYSDFYEDVAEMIFHLLFNAATVQEPQELCWSVQHNTVWGDFFQKSHIEGPVTKVVCFKVRRLLYDEVRKLDEFPNYVGARILGLLFNMLGFNEARYSYTAETRPLQRAVLAWTRRRYAIFARDNPRLAAASLVAGITYDAEKYLLAKTGMQLLDREPSRSTLIVNSL